MFSKMLSCYCQSGTNIRQICRLCGYDHPVIRPESNIYPESCEDAGRHKNNAEWCNNGVETNLLVVTRLVILHPAAFCIVPL